jgi:hypothetical protein
LESKLCPTIEDGRRGGPLADSRVSHDLQIWTRRRLEASLQRQRRAMATEVQKWWVASSLRLILASRSQVGGRPDPSPGPKSGPKTAIFGSQEGPFWAPDLRPQNPLFRENAKNRPGGSCDLVFFWPFSKPTSWGIEKKGRFSVFSKKAEKNRKKRLLRGETYRGSQNIVQTMAGHFSTNCLPEWFI